MAIQPQQPADLQPNPIMPAGPEPLLMEAYDGVNTSTLRPGVPDKQCYWIDGFMPLAPRNLRTLYGKGTALYTSSSQNIVLFGFFNIGTGSFMVVFLSDGSAKQVALADGTTTTIMPAGTLNAPSITNIGISQYGSTYLIIVANQTNGYWLWSGTTLFTAGTLAPDVVVTNSGAGYSTVPTIVVSGGSGSGAILNASISNGQVTDISVVNAGSGYLAGETVTLTLTGGTTSGVNAAATAVMTNASSPGSGATVTVNTLHNYGTFYGLLDATYSFGSFYGAAGNINISNAGSGYTQFATLSIVVDGAQWVAPPSGYVTIVGGAVASITITYQGICNISSAGIAISVNDPGGFYVSSVNVTNGGSGYSPSATVTGSGGSSPGTQATYHLVISGGVITSITVTSGGLYGGSSPPSLTFHDTSVTATATASLMPFAIQGNAVETYSGHVWVAQGDVLYWTAPGSAFDFTTTNGGGNNTDSTSTLKVKYTRLLNTNGFLWLIGDSSLNYISGVQTGGSPLATTFTLQNADPEVGTPWPAAVLSFGRDVTFANTWGVHDSKGSAVEKVSGMLDGVYNTVIPFDASAFNFTFQPSAAKAIVFGRKVWSLLLPIVNPITGLTEKKLLMWDGKRWWASSQDLSLIFIASLEINSLLIAYGTDGTVVYPLFNQPTTGFTKYVQSKLWDPGGYWLANATTRFWAMLKYYSMAYSTLNVTIDNENYPSNTETLDISLSLIVTWTNHTGVTVVWQNHTAQTVTWYGIGPGYTIVQPTAVAQQGVLAGFTFSTSDADMAIISAALKPEIVQYRG